MKGFPPSHKATVDKGKKGRDSGFVKTTPGQVGEEEKK